MNSNGKKFSKLILRERVNDGAGKSTGWLILGVDQQGVAREVLAILTSQISLDTARHFSQILAKEYQLGTVLEELTSPDDKAKAVEFKDYSSLQYTD
jgi:hypothetical protein